MSKSVISSEDGKLLKVTETGSAQVEVQNFPATQNVSVGNFPATQNVQLTGSNAKEPFSGSANVTHNFTQPMNGFVISNDGASDLTFTIGTYTFIVKAGEVFQANFAPFTSVTVTTTVAFRAYGLGA